MVVKHEKIPLSKVKKLPYQSLNRMIRKMREYLKKNEVVQKMFKEYDVDIEEIDLIPMMFGNLDVSAKTDHGVIIYNYRLLTDGDFFKDFSYGVHEMTHWLQQTTGTKATKSSDDGSYLDNPFEQEGFQNQVQYIADQFGDGEAEKYVDDLLEHHEIEDKKEVEEKKEILMAKASEVKDLGKKTRISMIKKLISKYHSDKETADAAKYRILVDELLRLQQDNQVKDPQLLLQPIQEEPILFNKNHPWGNWFDKYVKNK